MVLKKLKTTLDVFFSFFFPFLSLSFSHAQTHKQIQQQQQNILKTRTMSSTQSSEDVKCNKSEQHTNIPVQKPAVECRCRQTSKTLTFPRLLCPFAITTTSFICLIPQKKANSFPLSLHIHVIAGCQETGNGHETAKTPKHY